MASDEHVMVQRCFVDPNGGLVINYKGQTRFTHSTQESQDFLELLAQSGWVKRDDGPKALFEVYYQSELQIEP